MLRGPQRYQTTRPKKEKMTLQPAMQKGGAFTCAEVVQGMGSSMSPTRKLRCSIRSFDGMFLKEREELWKKGILCQGRKSCVHYLENRDQENALWRDL